MDTTIFSCFIGREIEICRRSPRFQCCGICELQATPLVITRKHYLIVLIMKKPQNGLTKRKGPTWCKNVRKQMFFGFRYLTMAKKIYHALMVVYLVFYPRYHHECCKHGQWTFLDVWVGHRSLAQGLSPLIPSSWVCLGDTVHHCWWVLKLSLHSSPNTAGLISAAVIKPKMFLSLFFH